MMHLFWLSASCLGLQSSGDGAFYEWRVGDSWVQGAGIRYTGGLGSKNGRVRGPVFLADAHTHTQYILTSTAVSTSATTGTKRVRTLGGLKQLGAQAGSSSMPHHCLPSRLGPFRPERHAKQSDSRSTAATVLDLVDHDLMCPRLSMFQDGHTIYAQYAQPRPHTDTPKHHMRPLDFGLAVVGVNCVWVRASARMTLLFVARFWLCTRRIDGSDWRERVCACVGRGWH